MKVVVPQPTGTPDEYQALRDAGHEVVFGREYVVASPDRPYSDRTPWTDEKLIELCRDADVIIHGSVKRPVMAAAPHLRLVVGPAIGYERQDVAGATELGIAVANSPSVENFTGVAETTIGLMMLLGKRYKHKEALIRRGQWGTDADRGYLLTGKTVGIIGFGRTGSGVAKRLQGWDCRVIAYDPYISPEKTAMYNVELVDDLSTLLRESDYVTLHVVVTPETTRMIGEEQLRMMKPTAYLINTSRGQVLDDEAFCKAINEGWIAGAALDVFWQEPLPMDSPLRQLDPMKVTLTPHNAATSPDSRVGNLRLAVQGALEALRGEVPTNIVNPEVIPRWKARFGRA